MVGRCGVADVGVSKYRAEWSAGVVVWLMWERRQSGRGQLVWRGCSGC